MKVDLITGLKEYIEKNGLLLSDDKVLVAVSGGVDSMVLLSLLVTSGYQCGVAHCNFQLRGEEADEDEVLVEREAERYGVSFYNKRFDTLSEMDRTGESLQIVARRLRYDWFDELVEEHGYTAVAIAHHADDSIETFFINMFRGTGLRGLTGISMMRGYVIRPLLFASRKDIIDYAVEQQIEFREDSSNKSTKYVRNKLRIGVIPRLKEIRHHFTETMGANIQRLTEAQNFIDHTITKIREQVEEHNRGLITIDPKKIDSDYPFNFVIYELLSTYGFRGDVIDSLCDSLERGVSGKRFYAKEMVAYIDRGRILIAPIESCDSCKVTIKSKQDKAYVGNAILYFEYFDIDQIETLHQPETIALFDLDKLTFPLIARRWEDGDWFIPLGMEGRKKVSDFLIDEKVSMAEKERQFVLLSGDEILWLVGRRIDERYRINGETENVLKITKEVL